METDKQPNVKDVGIMKQLNVKLAMEEENMNARAVLKDMYLIMEDVWKIRMEMEKEILRDAQMELHYSKIDVKETVLMDTSKPKIKMVIMYVTHATIHVDHVPMLKSMDVLPAGASSLDHT